MNKRKPSFPTPSYDSDGVHLDAYSGFEFVLHLFDSVQLILSQQVQDPETRSPVATESTRVPEDRVMVLKHDHRRLNQKFEHKAAVNYEQVFSMFWHHETHGRVSILAEWRIELNSIHYKLNIFSVHKEQKIQGCSGHDQMSLFVTITTVIKVVLELFWSFRSPFI